MGPISLCPSLLNRHYIGISQVFPSFTFISFRNLPTKWISWPCFFGFYWFIWFLRLCLALMTFVASRSPGPMFYRITLSFSPGKAKIRRSGVYKKSILILTLCPVFILRKNICYLAQGSRCWEAYNQGTEIWFILEGLLIPHHLSRGSKNTPQFSFPFILVVV